METPNQNLTDSEMKGVYSAISVSADDDVDANDEISFVFEQIQQIYDSTFLLIDSNELCGNIVTLNHKFVELIKHCVKEHNYKKIGWLFIGFCDFFDLDFSKAYSNLHEKIQNSIKRDACKICGKPVMRTMIKKTMEHPTLQVTTVFQLAQK